jgi:CubicO group peptidase (beta-lactamase class C family)
MSQSPVISRVAASLWPFFLLVFLSCSSAHNTSKDLETITPEEAGWSSEKLAEAAQYAGKIGYSAIMLAYDGKVFFSWGDVEKNYKCHSIRKPFLSALYGIYADNKTIDLDLTMKDLGIDDISPGLTDTEKQATIRQLLQSRSGIYHEAAGEAESMRAARPERGSHKPGEFFYYNNWDFNALGTIFGRLTGKDIFQEFKEKIANPIGMQDFDPDSCTYDFEKDKSEHPKYSFRMSARDLVRFGILYQKGGVWNGKRIIPEKWMSESTTAYSVADSALGAGFGYMWRTMAEGSLLARLMGGSGLFFSGMGVHSLTIMPELKVVQVIRMDTDGDWTPPAPGEGGKLYSMISGSRIMEEKPQTD